ncbi:hypothetical protein VIMS_04936 [Mycobacterium marinum]|uniref:hypothetical protein n=1 Tax=Mycobacterium marinum TaxID=1781 RepID=UPI000E3ED772|nr:hypothetical protein [Mycobacterium marinum]RFZ05434.1 hypothetical protein VIMS_04936 [Mycobacterium marinum]
MTTTNDEQMRFEAAVREHVREMSDEEFTQFIAETRPPTPPRRGDAGRAAAAKRFGTRKEQQ